jgi:hypothetical protein
VSFPAYTVKPKTCSQCPREFYPRSSMHDVCSQRCAMKKINASKAKERAETKARLRALETIPELIRAAQKEFNAWVRARDEGEPCICCGRRADDKNLLTGSRWDAGHYRSTGSASHLRFNEDNCHRQLVSCNRHGAGRAVDYRIGLIKRIGLERVEALESNNAIHKWTADELRAIRDTYRAKARELKKGQEA